MFRLCLLVCLAGCLVQAVSQGDVDKCRLSGTGLSGKVTFPAPLHTGTELECVEACLQNAECEGFGWVESSGNCYGRTNITKQYTAKDWNSFLMSCVKEPKPALCTIPTVEKIPKLSGGSLNHLQNITEIRCAEGFLTNGGTTLSCNNGILTYSPESQPTSCSACKAVTDECVWEEKPGMDIKGGFIGLVKLNAEEAKKMCAGLEKCKAITCLKKKCFLNSSTGKQQERKGHTSFICTRTI